MTTVIEQENTLLEEVKTLKHMTQDEINTLLLAPETKEYIGYRILFILDLIKVGDWSYEEGIEEIRDICSMIVNK